MYARLDDAPIRGIAAGLITTDDGSQVGILLQADTTQVVILDVPTARALGEGILALIPFLEGQRIPDELKSVDFNSDDAERIAKRVAKNRKRLGLMSDGGGQ